MIDIAGKLHLKEQIWNDAQRDALERLHDGLWEDVSIFCEKLDSFKVPFIFDVSMDDKFPYFIETRKESQSLTMEEFVWWMLSLNEWGRKHSIEITGFIGFEESNGEKGEVSIGMWTDNEVKVSTVREILDEVDIEEFAGEIIPWNHGDSIDQERDGSKMKN